MPWDAKSKAMRLEGVGDYFVVTQRRWDLIDLRHKENGVRWTEVAHTAGWEKLDHLPGYGEIVKPFTVSSRCDGCPPRLTRSQSQLPVATNYVKDDEMRFLSELDMT